MGSGRREGRPVRHGAEPVADEHGEANIADELTLPGATNAGDVHATVSLYSQTLPPYFLAHRYETKTPATERLAYLENSLMTLDGTDYSSWKMQVASTHLLDTESQTSEGWAVVGSSPIWGLSNEFALSRIPDCSDNSPWLTLL